MHILCPCFHMNLKCCYIKLHIFLYVAHVFTLIHITDICFHIIFAYFTLSFQKKNCTCFPLLAYVLAAYTGMSFYIIFTLFAHIFHNCLIYSHYGHLFSICCIFYHILCTWFTLFSLTFHKWHIGSH